MLNIQEGYTGRLTAQQLAAIFAKSKAIREGLKKGSTLLNKLSKTSVATLRRRLNANPLLIAGNTRITKINVGRGGKLVAIKGPTLKRAGELQKVGHKIWQRGYREPSTWRHDPDAMAFGHATPKSEQAKRIVGKIRGRIGGHPWYWEEASEANSFPFITSKKSLIAARKRIDSVGRNVIWGT